MENKKLNIEELRSKILKGIEIAFENLYRNEIGNSPIHYRSWNYNLFLIGIIP